MSPDQPRPVRTRRTLRRRSRTPRGPRMAEPENEAAPLGHLQKRCAGGACIAGVGYLTVVFADVALPGTLTFNQFIGLEFGIGFLGVLLTLVAVVLWLLTQNTAYTLRLLDMIDAAHGASTADVGTAIPSPRQNIATSAPIPIERGHQVRQRRAQHRAG